MILYTIGFTKKNAEQFFNLLIHNNVKRLIDIRLNTKSQLAGFAKGEDLAYLLPKVAKIEYIYRPEYAPTKELLDGFRNKDINWAEYEEKYIQILEEREILHDIDCAQFDGACLLCSEDTPEMCHRRLLAEYITTACKEIKVVHLVG